tara:strand:+ start:246 stop:395 length:150 start_codon:yes stop_codon:yes gene_type:complete
MVISFTLIFSALGYLFYKSKKEVTLVDNFETNKSIEEEELYKDIEDLFI